MGKHKIGHEEYLMNIRDNLLKLRSSLEFFDAKSGESILDSYLENTLNNIEDELISLEVYVEEMRESREGKCKRDRLPRLLQKASSYTPAGRF